MAGLLNVLLTIVAILAAFFVITFTVYMFNLDMKLMAAVHPVLLKLYDKRKRKRRL